MDLGLDGKLCVVTGGTRGIGAATAETLAREGARVLTVARSEADVELDVTEPDSGERLLAACEGAPWALVNCAGTARARPLEELRDADWQEAWELHVMATLRLSTVLAPAMGEAGGGRIVIVASSSGKRPSQTLDASYSVTKTAQIALARLLAERYGPDRVLVNSLVPGPVETPLWTAPGGLADEVAERSGKGRDEVLASTHAKALTGRMSKPEEVAVAIAFLCSGHAGNVAGAAWAVDGGSTPSLF